MARMDDFFTARIDIPPGTQTLLDLGCGTGLYHLDTPCTVDNQIRLLLKAGFAQASIAWRRGATVIIVAEAKSEGID